MRVLIFTVLAFGFSSAFASIGGDTWSLNKGRKHPLFSTGKSIESLERQVFSDTVPFAKRWSLVSEVAGLKEKDESVRFLTKCLKAKEWFLQSAALKVLTKKNPELAMLYAEKMMFNAKALVVRSEAVEVIEKLGGPRDTAKLWKVLKQRKNFNGRKSLWIRPQIVKTIYKLERSKRSKNWNNLLTDSDSKIKEMAKRVISVK